MLSEVVRKLREVRGMAWAGLIPAIDHAIMRAEECEFIAAEASNLAQCAVEPAYPPLVLKLAAALGVPEEAEPEVTPTEVDEPPSGARVVSRPFDSDCAIGICPHRCSHLMWRCDRCNSEGGWGAPDEKLRKLAAEHVCAAVPPVTEEAEHG